MDADDDKDRLATDLAERFPWVFYATFLGLRNPTAQGLLLKAKDEAVRIRCEVDPGLFQRASRRTPTCEVELPATSTSPPLDEVARTTELEIELIERVCVGEKELFYELISPYERSVYMAAFSVLQNEADAEEAAQEAFLKAFSHLSSFRRESKFSTWLIQIAVNEARMKRRKDRRAALNVN